MRRRRSRACHYYVIWWRTVSVEPSGRPVQHVQPRRAVLVARGLGTRVQSGSSVRLEPVIRLHRPAHGVWLHDCPRGQRSRAGGFAQEVLRVVGWQGSNTGLYTWIRSVTPKDLFDLGRHIATHNDCCCSSLGIPVVRQL